MWMSDPAPPPIGRATWRRTTPWTCPNGWNGNGGPTGPPAEAVGIPGRLERRAGDWVHVSVARPPRDVARATHLALEHVLTGADNINDGTVPYPEYAASLVDCPLWSVWWD
ncbi:DUF4253 domain-containing protein [Streptomyces sp. NPDC020917]|uniref:DUF4253 domain-containing protein n=1 Tax=Streptomyces sp. NPDC020917 TaxID=3365102 RepID=UPI003794E0E0